MVDLTDADIVNVIRAERAQERERCAKIAEGFKPNFCGDDKDLVRSGTAGAIADAIRALT